MIADEHLPGGWEARSARSVYDELMDRTFECRVYGHGDASVRINEVQEPEEFGGWGFHVVADPAEPTLVGLGLHEDLEAARAAAIEYMADNPAG